MTCLTASVVTLWLLVAHSLLVAVRVGRVVWGFPGATRPAFLLVRVAVSSA